MDYDRIILEMLDRIKTLEEQVAELKGEDKVKKFELHIPAETKPSKKYRRLTEFLSESGEKCVTLTFEQIESMIGFELPPSARKYKEFWSNTTSHPIALSWLNVGYQKIDVALDKETILLEKLS